MRRAFALLPLALALIGAQGPEGTTVLWGGFVFDGTGSDSRIGTLVMERNRIAALLPEGETGWPEGSRVLDVTGHTVLPGLIDVEARLADSEPDDPARQTLRALERLHLYLWSGITSIRDVGSAGAVASALRDWVRENRIPGPRIFLADRALEVEGVGLGLAGDGFRDLPRAYVRELEARVEAGFTEAEALLAGTLDSARALGMGDELGSLEVGKLADVLVVEGDPLTDVGAIANVAEVFRDGRWVVRRGAVTPIPPERGPGR